MKAIATIGHSNRSIESFCGLLALHRVSRLVDVRRYPSSTYSPHFNHATLATSIRAREIVYEHIPTLGGMRESSVNPTRNGAWVEPAFRAYADFALTPAFHAALAQLIEHAKTEMCAIMCAERDWRQCHRQIIADYLITRGSSVIHLIDEDRIEQGRASPEAVVQNDGTILYPPRQGELGLT